MHKLIAASVIWALAILTSSCQAQPQRGAQSRDFLFTPAPGSPADVGGRPSDIAVGDWNVDGRLDVVTCNVGDTATVLLGNGRGGFTPVPGSPFAVGRAPYPHAQGDVNGDGNLDIVTANNGSGDMTVLLGK